MTKKMRTLLPVVVLALAGCGDGVPERLTVGGQLPEFSLESLAGTKFDSSSLAGKAVVVNFWATWCQPCLKEIPELNELAAGGRVEVVGIALDEEGELAVKPFALSHGMEYTILLGNQKVFQRMGGFSIPYTLVVDGSQRVVNIYRGPATRTDIEEDLKKIEQAV
jgi:thiol-disulfide isomerase/thioredoxin